MSDFDMLLLLGAFGGGAIPTGALLDVNGVALLDVSGVHLLEAS